MLLCYQGPASKDDYETRVSNASMFENTDEDGQRHQIKLDVAKEQAKNAKGVSKVFHSVGCQTFRDRIVFFYKYDQTVWINPERSLCFIYD